MRHYELSPNICCEIIIFSSFQDIIITYSSHFFFISIYFLKKHLVVSLINLIPLLLYFNIVGVRPKIYIEVMDEMQQLNKPLLCAIAILSSNFYYFGCIWMITLTFDTI